MSKTTITSTKNLKSGHTVWRVLINYSIRQETLAASVWSIYLKGARKKENLFGHIYTPKIGRDFLNDVIGHGIRGRTRTVLAFRSYRAAQRFCREVEQGRHDAEFLEICKDDAEWSQSFADILSNYPLREDYDSYGYGSDADAGDF